MDAKHSVGSIVRVVLVSRLGGMEIALLEDTNKPVMWKGWELLGEGLGGLDNDERRWVMQLAYT